MEGCLTDNYRSSRVVLNLADNLRVEKNFVRYALSGEVSLKEGVGMVSSVLACCREQHHRRLLIDVTNLYGFDFPTFGERYRIALQWARIAGTEVIAAMVARPELIHPEQVIVYVAAREGFHCGAFTEESAAIEWLLSQ